MLEIDILPDGQLAVPNEAFNYLDAAIVSIHSNFTMDKKSMTDRIIKGLSHPKARILAHPTGRLLNKRPGYEVDWTRLFDFVRQENKILEINSYYDRLDLSDTLVFETVKKGIKLSIDTDSHQHDQLEFMRYGISVARRGWAGKNDIINTLDYNSLVRLLTR